jgi:NADH-quinone oxidoreductase subunit J
VAPGGQSSQAQPSGVSREGSVAGRPATKWTTMLMFYVFGAIAIVASLLVIGQRNPVYSVLLLIASFGALSGLYVLLEAPFVAVIQIIVYAGAIMVLFLFVVMLLNAPREETEQDERLHALLRRGPTRFGAALAAALLGELWWALARGGETGAFPGAAVSSVDAIGRSLFTDYSFQFEITSVLVLVAMVGAVVLARRDPRPSLGGRASNRPGSD